MQLQDDFGNAARLVCAQQALSVLVCWFGCWRCEQRTVLSNCELGWEEGKIDRLAAADHRCLFAGGLRPVL